MSRISSEERGAFTASTLAFPEGYLWARMRTGYYTIAYSERVHTAEDSLGQFRERLEKEEVVPPAVLAMVNLRDFDPDTVSELAARRLVAAVAEARAPLRRRVERVTRTLVAHVQAEGVTARLDDRLGLSAGAEVGMSARRVLIGPDLVLLASRDDELAFVLAHEIAHIARRHTRDRAVQDFLMGLMTGGYTWYTRDEIASGILSWGAIPAYSRDMECEADYYALGYLRSAGYRPDVGIRFLRTLSALRRDDGVANLPILASHPHDMERLLRMARWEGIDPESDRWRYVEDFVPSTSARARQDWTLREIVSRLASQGSSVDVSASGEASEP